MPACLHGFIILLSAFCFLPSAFVHSPAKSISAAQARRYLLAAQGLLDDPNRHASPAAVRRVVQQMGFVQIDSINTVERAHHLILFTRLHGYRQPMLARLLEDTRDLFEHWTHDASAIPTGWFSQWRHRFERYRLHTRTHKWWTQRMGPQPEKTIDMVRRRIERDGPLLSRDFQHDRANHRLPEDGWWGWKPQKAALEHLWRIGELAVTRRVNFQKVYDLTERVLPDAHRAPAPPLDEHTDWACRSALERLGFATPREIAAFWNAIDLAQARQWCEQALRTGRIIPVSVESADGSPPRRALALRDIEHRMAKCPTIDQAGPEVRVLAPFDPALRDRQRTRRLFNFDYTLEAFVPSPRRRYGYYVLPLLRHDRFIGRIDPKFHRERSVLEIRGLWLEPRITPARTTRRAIESAIERLAQFIGAQSIHMPR